MFFSLSIVIILFFVLLVSFFKIKLPFAWFLFFYANFFIGTAWQMDLFPDESNLIHFFSILAGLTSYFAVSSMLVRRWNLSDLQENFNKQPVIISSPLKNNRIFFFLLFSLIISAIYYISIGQNILFMILAGTEFEDFSGTRISMYSGEEYYYPGYVNQFKNTIFPICAAYYLSSEALRSKSIFLKLLILVPIGIFILAGTGQRAFLVHSFLALCLTYFLTFSFSKKMIFNLFLGTVIVFIVFSILSFFYYDLSEEGFFGVIVKLVERIFFVQQEGGLVGFHVIYDLPRAYLTEWWASIVGILPNVSGSDLAHQIHEIMYGSSRGTVPISHVGSAYYNGGFFLVLVFFGILGFFHTYLFLRFISGKKLLFRCICYGFIFHYSSALLFGGPFTYIDNGLITIFILLYIVQKVPVITLRRI